MKLCSRFLLSANIHAWGDGNWIKCQCHLQCEEISSFYRNKEISQVDKNIFYRRIISVILCNYVEGFCYKNQLQKYTFEVNEIELLANVISIEKRYHLYIITRKYICDYICYDCYKLIKQNNRKDRDIYKNI